MNSWLQDLRFARRQLVRTAGTSATIVGTIAAGICAATTVFSAADALLFAPLPGVQRQAELVNVHATAPDGSSFHSVSHPTYRDLRDGASVFSGLAAFSSRLVSLHASGEPRLAVVQIVTGNYFEVVGARPALGRFFGPAEDTAPGRDAVVVLSDGTWKTQFGSDPRILGRVVRVNGHPFTVVGVAEAGFQGTFHAFPFDLWIPTMMASAVASGDRIEDRRMAWLEMVGRLSPGVSIETARSAMAGLARRIAAAHPETDRDLGYDVRRTQGFEDELRGPAVGFFSALGALAALVLLIAAANVSALWLARLLARDRELAVRMALGAGRGRLVRLLVIENLLLFLAGGAVGLFLTRWTTGLLESFDLPTPVPIAFALTPGPRVIVFAMTLAALAGLLSGLWAAMRATRPASTALLGARAGSDSASATRLRSAFVTAQIAMAVLLLVTTGLCLRAVRKGLAADPGFAAEGLVMTSLDLSLVPGAGDRQEATFEQIAERARNLSGAESSALTSLVPLGPGHSTEDVSLPGRVSKADRVQVDVADVSEGYFRTMRIPILRGRAFSREDRRGSLPVAIVNETLARHLWPGAEAVGQRLQEGDQTLTVVGVARDGKYRQPWEAPRPLRYRPDAQTLPVRRTLVVRAAGSGEALAPALRRAIRDVEPGLPLAAILTVRKHIGFAMLPQRVAAAVSAGLGGVGLSLALIGVSGLVAFSVARRTREIGIRMALGAAPHQVVAREIRRALSVAAIGLGIGGMAALALTRLLSGLLSGVDTADPLTFGLVAVVLAAAALFASYFPARRAARIDPVAALRSE